MPVTSSVYQARFWRRAIALMIDLAAVYGALAFAGVLLFQATDGAIRIGRVPLVEHSVCRSVAAELRWNSNSEKTETKTCESSLFGFVHDRRVEFSQRKQTGSVTQTRSVTHPVDAQGRETSAFYLDQLLALLLAAYLLVAEWRFGTTLGKRVVGVHVRAEGGIRLRLKNICKRLLRFVPAVPVVCAGLVAMAIDPAGEAALATALGIGVLGLYALSAALCIAVLANFVMAVTNDDLPWHDQWAGTEVVINGSGGRVRAGAMKQTGKV